MTEIESSGSTDDQQSTGISRRTVIASGASLLGTTLIAGCGGDGDSTATETEDDNGNGGTPTDEPTEIAIVSSPAGFDDNAFNDLALQGLQTAAEDYNININQVEETEQGNYASVQQNLAESSDPDYDLIVLVGFNHTSALETNAEEYGEQNWMLINDYYDSSNDNVAGYTWANHEMSFLAGVAAATMTTRDFSNGSISTDPDGTQIGFVGGVDGSLIQAFEESYIAGAEYINEDISVNVGYAGTFSDPQAANDVAASQYDDGADIIYHAASAAGEGVFQAAQSADRFAVGVDADQSQSLSDYSDVILGSAVKFINEGTQEVATAVAEDDFASVQGATTLSIDDEGVDFVIGQDFTSDSDNPLPDAVSTNVEDAKTDITEGNVEVPCSASGCN